MATTQLYDAADIGADDGRIQKASAASHRGRQVSVNATLREEAISSMIQTSEAMVA